MLITLRELPSIKTDDRTDNSIIGVSVSQYCMVCATGSFEKIIIIIIIIIIITIIIIFGLMKRKNKIRQ